MAKKAGGAAPRARGRHSSKPPGPVEVLRLVVSLCHLVFSVVWPLVSRFGDHRALYSLAGLALEFVLYQTNVYRRWVMKRCVQACILLYVVDKTSIKEVLRIDVGPSADATSFLDPIPTGIAVGVGIVGLLSWLWCDGILTSANLILRSESWNPCSEGSGLDGSQGRMIAWCRVLAGATLVPLLEELEFRGLAADVLPGGAATATLLYGFTNENWAGALLTGAAYAALHARYGLWAAVLAHAVVNLGQGCVVLRTGRWHLW